MVQQTGPKDSTRTGNHAPMASEPPGGSPRSVPTRNAATPPPGPKKKGGRKREDGLVAGSPEAEAADRERDRLRKQQERALVDPPALPSTDPDNGDQDGTAPGAQGPGPGDSASVPTVPWESKDFVGRFGTLFKGAESNRMAKREHLAREAGFSEPNVQKFVNGARYPGAATAELCEDMADGAAWVANKLKMSRGAVKGGFGAIAAIFFFTANRRSDAEFAKAIAEMKKGNQPEEKKP